MDNILNMETEINDILKNSDTAKRYVSGKKLNSKVEMAKVIDTQSREVAALKEENAKNAKDNAVMKAEIEALKKQVEALAAKK